MNRKISRRMAYTDQFRADAVKRVTDGGHAPMIAQDLGINVSTLYNWVAKSRKANPVSLTLVPEPEQKRTAQENAFQELVEDEINNLEYTIASMEERRDALQRYLEL